MEAYLSRQAEIYINAEKFKTVRKRFLPKL